MQDTNSRRIIAPPVAFGNMVLNRPERVAKGVGIDVYFQQFVPADCRKQVCRRLQPDPSAKEVRRYRRPASLAAWPTRRHPAIPPDLMMSG